ncbi:MAG: WXG100 family type VII secretion target, partial [Jatrophihabitans sp.]
MMFPPSYAMDATAASGGPSTVLPQIVTGSPETILAHVSELLQKAQQFSSLIEEFKKAETQLQQAWSGHAADSAVKKIENSLSSFTEIVNVINRGAQLLQQSATMITTAQTGYTSVVGAVNPTVAGLMSNPYTYSAAVALSTSSSAALKGFITAVSGLLKTLGAVNLASELTTVGTIISQLEQLFNNKGSGATASTGSTGGTGSTATGTGTPVTAPVAPTSVASAAGLQGLANPAAPAAAPAASSTPTSLQNGEQGLLHTPDGKLYTADGQPLLTANGSPAYQNYQPAALTGLPNSVGVPATGAPVSSIPTTRIPGLSTAGLTTPQAGTDSWLVVDPSQHAG